MTTFAQLPAYNDPEPTPLLDYFRSTVHTGRGTGHLNAITDVVVAGLAAHPLIAPVAAAGDICYFAGARQGERGTDLQFGPTPAGAVFDSVVGMAVGRPTEVRIV